MASSIGDHTPKSLQTDSDEAQSSQGGETELTEVHHNGEKAGKGDGGRKTYSIGASVVPYTNGADYPRSPYSNGDPKSPISPMSPALSTFRAPAFNAPSAPPPAKRGPLMLPEGREFQRYQRVAEINWFGMMVFIVYLISFIFYMWIRIAKTLDLGQYVAYGYYVLGVEILGASTVIFYGTNLLWNPVITPYEEDPNNPGMPLTKNPYHVRVLVPCYKESLEILRRTVMAAYDAVLPEGCSRTIYLLDDGKDPKKRKWVDSLGADVVYVSGRKRPAGEMNGKSGNLNNAISQVYPRGTQVPGNELVCIFDADQVASREFFLKTLPLFDGGDDVGMVLSPQCFHNLNLHSDIFNHSNVHFWEYMQPGYDALGFISCTGTNFLVRSNALLEVGGSPTWTLTEDFALGMEMKKYGWHCRYVQEYLAIGEAPDQIRNCYQQRSRWCKGHFQIMFNKEHNPLTQKRLSFFMKLLYTSGVWSYIVGAISTPTFIAIPCITIWFGVFPIVVSWWAALGITVYGITTHCVLYYVRSHKHIEALWFANTANSLLWFTYVKAFWRALNSVFGEKIQFKTTLKGASLLMNTAFRDLWMPALCFCILAASVGEGLYQLFTTATITSPLAMSVIWAVYNAIPPGLVLFYAFAGKGTLLQYLCRFCLLLSFFCSFTAIGLIWGLYPRDYDFGEVIGYSNFYYDAQRSGTLPDNDVSWLGNSLTTETGPLGRAMTGGWYEGGAGYQTKITIPTAFTVAMLAWGLTGFPDGYSQAGQTNNTLNTIKWGSDYLLECVGSGANGSSIVYQMGNLTISEMNWQAPEDITAPQPYYALPTSQAGADLGGAITGALAASAYAHQQSDPAYYTTLMTAAQQVYTWSSAYAASGPLYSAALGKLTCSNFPDPNSNTNNCTQIQTNGSSIPLYDTTTKYDAMLWAALWMYQATGDQAYMQDAQDFYQIHLYSEPNGNTNDALLVFDWSDYFWAGNVLLAQLTDEQTYHEQTQTFLTKWVCGTGGVIQYTPRGRAYNQNSPSLGATANVAFLAAFYAKAIDAKGEYGSLASRYWCWARTQTRYVLGDAGRSFVAGYGTDPPTHCQNAAASCPAPPQTCTYVTNFLSPEPNTNVLYGALVEGDGFTDSFQDVRSANGSRVQIEFNSGFQGSLASMLEAPGTWEQCLQGYGALTRGDNICS